MEIKLIVNAQLKILIDRSNVPLRLSFRLGYAMASTLDYSEKIL